MPANHPDDDLFLASVLDELEVAEREAVKLHLGQCTLCAQQAAQLANLLTAVRVQATSPAPVGVLVKLLERQASRQRRPNWIFYRPLHSLAAGIVLAILAFLAGQMHARRETDLVERPVRVEADRGNSVAH